MGFRIVLGFLGWFSEKNLSECPVQFLAQRCAKSAGLLLVVLLCTPSHFSEPLAQVLEKQSGEWESEAVLGSTTPALAVRAGLRLLPPSSRCSAVCRLFITLQSLMGHKLSSEGLVKLSYGDLRSP